MRSQKKQRAGQLWQLVALQVFEEATVELETYSRATGKFLLPNVDPSNGEEVLKMVKWGMRNVGGTSPPCRKAVLGAWGQTLEMLMAVGDGMDDMQKRLFYRQAIKAAGLIYLTLFDPTAKQSCGDAVREALDDEDGAATLW